MGEVIELAEAFFLVTMHTSSPLNQGDLSCFRDPTLGTPWG